MIRSLSSLLTLAILATSILCGSLTTAEGVTYYVRTSGSDSNSGQNNGLAFKTIAKAASVAGPGDTVYVGAGTYAHTTQVNFTISGTASNPCRYIADKTGARTGDAGDVIIQAPKTLGSTWTWVLHNLTDYEFEGFKFVEDPTANVAIYTATNATEYNNFFTSNWSLNYNLSHSFYLSRCTRVTVKDCTFNNHYVGLYVESSVGCTVTGCSFNDPRYIGLNSSCNRTLTVTNCSFTNSTQTTTYNYGYQLNSWASEISITGCTFNNLGVYNYEKTLNRNDANYSYKRRAITSINHHGMTYDSALSTTYATSYNASSGYLTVENCSFSHATNWGIVSTWSSDANIKNNTLNNCLYGIYAYNQKFTLDGNTIEQTNDSNWNKGWSYGVYANNYCATDNVNNTTNAYYNTWITTGAKGGVIKNTTIKNCVYGLLLASSGVTLDTLTITGNTDWVYNSSTGQWSGNNYTYGIYSYEYANNLTFSNAQNLTLSGHWITYYNYAPNTKYQNLSITGYYAGVYSSQGSVDFDGTTVTGCTYYGAMLSQCTSVKATNSQFVDNCKLANYGGWGWGLYYHGSKTPRTPYTPGDSNWNEHLERNVYGTPEGDVNIQNCTFSRNGVKDSIVAGGLYLGSINKNKIVLANNSAEDNGYYGAYLFDSEWSLSNNQEFTSLDRNAYGLVLYGYRDTTNEALPFRSNKATINGYTVKDCNYGIYAADSYLTLKNSTVKDNLNYGVIATNGHATLENNTITGNDYGVYAAYNLTNTFLGGTYNSNKTMGLHIYYFTTWLGVSRPYSLSVDGVTANSNGHSGVYCYGVEYDVDGRTHPVDNHLYSIKNTTCNSNGSYGIYLHYGWFAETANLNIACQNNGTTDSNWGVGIYANYPGCDINLASDTGIVTTGNSWSGIYIYDFFWDQDYTTGMHWLMSAQSNVTINGYTMGSNKQYGIYVFMPNNVTVTNSTFNGGLYVTDPQGTVNLTGSTFQNCQYGARVDWGNSQYYNDLINDVVANSWWNTYAEIAEPLHKPVAVNVSNCNFTGNVWSGYISNWWYEWDDLSYDAASRITINVNDSTFTNNGCRGLELYNNHLNINNCNLSGNGYSALLVWNGATEMDACTVENNAFGRWNGTTHGFGEGTKASWVACEISHWYEDGRVWNHTIKNSTFNNNEANALYVYGRNGGTTTISNVQANNNLNSGVYLVYTTANLTDVTANSNGNDTVAGTGIASYYNNVTLTECIADSNRGWGIYVHGNYIYDEDTSTYYANNNNQATIQQCTANNNYGGGILSWCNIGVISDSQALNNMPPNTNISGVGIQYGHDNKAQTSSHTITNCAASGGWVGMYGYNTRATISNCTVNNGRYGGIYQYSVPSRNLASLSVANTSCSNNGCFGVYATHTSAQLNAVQCNNNGRKADGTPSGYGGYGMIFTANSTADGVNSNQAITSCDMSNNVNHGIYAYYQNSQAVERCTLNQNGSWGYYLIGSAAVKNNVISNNAYGAYLSDSTTNGIDFWNNTLANNTEIAMRFNAGSAEVRNNIAANSKYGMCIDNATVVNSNNLISGSSIANYWHPTKSAAELKGVDDINKSPRFVDAANKDYRLAKGSPAINSGFAATGVADIDILGNARPMYKSFEIGAYEYTDPSGSVRVLSWNEQQ